MKSLLPLAFSIAALVLSNAVAADAPNADTEAGPKVNYTFGATVVRVVDADTVMLDVDLGFSVWLHHQLFKIQGVKAPAADGPDKAVALQWKSKVQEILPAGMELILKSSKDKNSKGVTFYALLYKDGVNLNDQILKAVSGDTAQPK